MKGVLPVSLLRRELRQQFGDDTQASIAWFISRTKKNNRMQRLAFVFCFTFTVSR